jgi:hypothetical protein
MQRAVGGSSANASACLRNWRLSCRLAVAGLNCCSLCGCHVCVEGCGGVCEKAGFSIVNAQLRTCKCVWFTDCLAVPAAALLLLLLLQRGPDL